MSDTTATWLDKISRIASNASIASNDQMELYNQALSRQRFMDFLCGLWPGSSPPEPPAKAKEPTPLDPRAYMTSPIMLWMIENQDYDPDRRYAAGLPIPKQG